MRAQITITSMFLFIEALEEITHLTNVTTENMDAILKLTELKSKLQSKNSTFQGKIVVALEQLASKKMFLLLVMRV